MNMVRIASEDTCLGGLNNLDTGGMEEAPCLVEKVLSMLIAMGSARPKTLQKLENALRPCTKVVPFYNPFEALRTANAMVEHPPPMVDVHYTKSQTSIISATYKLDLDFQEEIQTNAEEDCVFDVAVQYGEVERSIIKDAQAWVHQCEKHEGTKKELLKDFFKHCMKRVNHSSLEVAKKLEAKGYLKIDGDMVSYFLPKLHTTLSSQLKSISDGQSRTKTSSFNMVEVIDDIDIKDAVREWLAEGSDIDPYDIDIDTINVDVTGGGPEEYLMDILVLQTLSSITKPSNLTDLLDLIKPQRLTYVVPPQRMIMQTVSEIKHTQGKKKSQQIIQTRTKTNRTYLAIGNPLGESQRRKQVPLMPEGLLGIDSHIFSTDKNSTNSVNSSQPKGRPNQQSVILQSKGFTASLNRRLACQTSGCSAVLAPALECEKQEVVARVINWVDSYRSGGSSEHCVKSQRPPAVKLRNQLIDLCTIKVRRMSATSIVGCLQRLGYVTIDSESPHKITYHIPTAKGPSGLQSTQKAPWQLQADDFRQTVQMCCSVYIERAFPSDISGSETSSKHQLSGKRKNSNTDQAVRCEIL